MFRGYLARRPYPRNTRENQLSSFVMTFLIPVMCWAHDFTSQESSRKLPTKHSVLLFWHICSTMSSPTLYIPTLPTYWNECFQRENPSHNPWELKIVILTILYTIHCGFPQLLPLHIQILKRLIAQTLTTPILSGKWGFGAVRKHWKKPFVWWIGLNCVIRKDREDKASSSQLVTRAWRAQVHEID